MGKWDKKNGCPRGFEATTCTGQPWTSEITHWQAFQRIKTTFHNFAKN